MREVALLSIVLHLYYSYNIVKNDIIYKKVYLQDILNSLITIIFTLGILGYLQEVFLIIPLVLLTNSLKLRIDYAYLGISFIVLSNLCGIYSYIISLFLIIALFLVIRYREAKIPFMAILVSVIQLGLLLMYL